MYQAVILIFIYDMATSSAQRTGTAHLRKLGTDLLNDMESSETWILTKRDRNKLNIFKGKCIEKF
jgi:hypothetical protein